MSIFLYHQLLGTQKTLEALSREFHQFKGVTVADLSKLSADLDAAKQSVVDLGKAVNDEVSAVDTKVAALQAQIDSLSVGAVTQDQIDNLDAAAKDVKSAVDSVSSTVTAETAKVTG